MYKRQEIYDTNENKTRDLEKLALTDTLKNYNFNSVLEAGCGTGKNTGFFLSKAKKVHCIDITEEMILKAQEKNKADNLSFDIVDIRKDWNLPTNNYDLIAFSLVLEHIENLTDIFCNASKVLKDGGLVYIGELHPFKQYVGVKAKFEKGDGLQVVDCFTHHISDFTIAAKLAGFQILDVNEYFDDDNRNSVPRILTVVFRKVSKEE
ncbi:MAG: class I SAM-dependent methyltransferase [Ignavibacteriaceae bacterium]|nr:class I SAM-dependent methyltransferase [Ignavibacteriaceae bacterium]